MPTNDFKAFATGNSANVISQADYLALAALVSGFSSGKASSAQINKALRQSTVMASVLAQFISDSAGVDVLDNGNTASILANLKSGMTALTPGRLLNVQVFTSSGTVTKTPGAKKWRIKCLGAGGGSSAAPATGSNEVSVSNGGGSGAYAEGIYDVSSITTASVVIGSGGAGGTAGSMYGADGGASSVGSFISSPGGKAGLPAGPANPPFQPVANNNGNGPTGWNIVGSSGAGAEPAVAVANSYAAGSRGSNSIFGVGGSIPAINNPANPGGGYGSGASGCSNGPSQSAKSGAAGRPGIVIIEEYA
ncbi:glycine-rich domain-containing protein [Klebsiella quasipneumoniae]